MCVSPVGFLETQTRYPPGKLVPVSGQNSATSDKCMSGEYSATSDSVLEMDVVAHSDSYLGIV